jgi:hypothetical protein
MVKKIITIVIIIILIIIIIYNNNKTYNCYPIMFINGYWSSDSDFNKIADIDNMLLYLDINNEYGKLIITKDNEIVSNDNMLFSISNISNKNDSLSFNIIFESENDNDLDFIWNNHKFTGILIFTTGNLQIYDNNNKTLYANLFKDNKITHYLNKL